MPLAHVLEQGRGFLALWRRDLSCDFEADLLFRARLRGSAIRYFEELKGVGRRHEWLIWQVMFRELLGDDLEVDYDEQGAPQVRGGAWAISVSHAAGYVVLQCRKTRCGVDVETLGRRFDRVAKRYLSAVECGRFAKYLALERSPTEDFVAAGLAAGNLVTKNAVVAGGGAAKNMVSKDCSAISFLAADSVSKDLVTEGFTVENQTCRVPVILSLVLSSEDDFKHGFEPEIGCENPISRISETFGASTLRIPACSNVSGEVSASRGSDDSEMSVERSCVSKYLIDSEEFGVLEEQVAIEIPDSQVVEISKIFPAVVWSAKEALYKYLHQPGLDLCNDLEIISCDWSTGRLKALAWGHQQIMLGFFLLDDHCVVYTL